MKQYKKFGAFPIPFMELCRADIEEDTIYDGEQFSDDDMRTLASRLADCFMEDWSHYLRSVTEDFVHEKLERPQ